MSGRRVFVVELVSPARDWCGQALIAEENAARYQEMFPNRKVVPYIPAEEAEEELEVYKLALRKACAKPTFMMSPPDPYDYVCRAREDIAAHKSEDQRETRNQ